MASLDCAAVATERVSVIFEEARRRGNMPGEMGKGPHFQEDSLEITGEGTRNKLHQYSR